ncbi:MAG: Leucine dehydrogenase [Chlamydiae bacterium]|nr:Leucine dehydrogenase [Chlamydiota bacterium]
MLKTDKIKIQEIDIPNYEKVIHAVYPTVGLNCFIAIHNTTLGPALGGTRIYPYKNEESALEDVLLLAKAMTYKSALAETGLGGGKAVIIANPETQKTKNLLLAYGEVVNYLKGRYIAAEDVGSTIHDMLIVNEQTPYVAALPTAESSGDPSRFTARGVYWGIKAAGKTLWGSDSLKDKKIAIQGLGSVGSKLARHLFWEGAILYVTDLEQTQIQNICKEYSAEGVGRDEIMQIECDIFTPCALGGILNEETIPHLACKGVAGSANNQLLYNHNGTDLMEREILYAPDFVINAGGIINAAAEFDEGGYSARKAMDQTNKIYNTLLAIFDIAHEERKPTVQVAFELAEYKLKNKIGKREKPITF